MSRTLKNAEKAAEFIQFTEYLQPKLQTAVSCCLFDSIDKGKIPLLPVELDGKPLTPFALSVNALPNHVREAVWMDLQQRVGEIGAPTQADLDDLEDLLEMADDYIMKMFEGMSLLIKRKVWRHLKGWQQRGLTRNEALLSFVPHLTSEESQLIFNHMKNDIEKSMPTLLATTASLRHTPSMPTTASVKNSTPSAEELVKQSDQLIDQSLEALRQFRNRTN